jgi:hypothetical protein
MRIRTHTDDNTLEMEMQSHSEADKSKVNARTRFNVREVYLYNDANSNGLMDDGEVVTAVEYDLSNQWGPITCSSSAPITCHVCNSGGLPADALCFDFVVTDSPVTFGTRTVTPTTVKIGMKWDPKTLDVSTNNRIAIIGRFRSQASFKDRVAVGDKEQEQQIGDGSSVKWEIKVYSPAGAASDVKVGVFIPSASGPTDGTEKDTTDGSSMSFRQLQFSFDATGVFTWDPDIVMPTAGASALVPLALLPLLTFLWL